MKVPLFGARFVLFTAPTGAGAGERLTMRVTPTVAFAPAYSGCADEGGSQRQEPVD